METTRPVDTKTALLWTGGYFGVMVLYTTLDLLLWRRFPPALAPWLNLFGIALLSGLFLRQLMVKTGWRPRLWSPSPGALLLALVTIPLLYLLLDRGIDPVLEGLFPVSETAYQETLAALAAAPLPAFLRVCLLAPVVEELLMRGFLLEGLVKSRGTLWGLLLSAGLFGLLHLSLVQGLSAFLCGLVLGLLALRTRSPFYAILAHGGYNLLSYLLMILPLVGPT